jgi:hypothetical protein
METFIKGGYKMKTSGRCVVGDTVDLDRYTSDWLSLRIHPVTFYRLLDEIRTTLSTVVGLYTEIDDGDFVWIRFSDRNDLIEFRKVYHEYL